LLAGRKYSIEYYQREYKWQTKQVSLLLDDVAGKFLEHYEHPELAGVRVVTRVERGPEVARALLMRNELSGVLWRRSLNIAGRARLEGTERPTLLEDLVRWGEEHTEFEYNPRYTSNR